MTSIGYSNTRAEPKACRQKRQRPSPSKWRATGKRRKTRRRLDYAVRARRDLEAIEKYHLEVAGDVLADRIIDAILSQAEKIAALGIAFRPGMRFTTTKT